MSYPCHRMGTRLGISRKKEMELDILMVIAEVAVALSGFSAVVANFSGNWTAAKSQ